MGTLVVTGGTAIVVGVGIPAMVSGGAVLLGINAGSKAVATIAVVTGASASVFGASDAAEGAQYLYKFFSQKDIEPVNFIRDNVPLFQKYPWLYAGVEFVTTLSAGASLNILNTQKNAAALSNGIGESSTIRGQLTGKLDGLTVDERKVVDDLLNSGNDVEIIPRSDVTKTPDYYVNGVKTELKTLNGSSLNTPVTRIQDGFKQGAENVIIDARKTNITIEQAENIIERAAGVYDGQLPGTVEIWTTGGNVTH